VGLEKSSQEGPGFWVLGDALVDPEMQPLAVPPLP
jgi:hypothetical protein